MKCIIPCSHAIMAILSSLLSAQVAISAPTSETTTEYPESTTGHDSGFYELIGKSGSSQQFHAPNEPGGDDEDDEEIDMDMHKKKVDKKLPNFKWTVDSASMDQDLEIIIKYISKGTLLKTVKLAKNLDGSITEDRERVLPMRGTIVESKSSDKDDSADGDDYDESFFKVSQVIQLGGHPESEVPTEHKIDSEPEVHIDSNDQVAIVTQETTSTENIPLLIDETSPPIHDQSVQEPVIIKPAGEEPAQLEDSHPTEPPPELFLLQEGESTTKSMNNELPKDPLAVVVDSASKDGDDDDDEYEDGDEDDEDETTVNPVVMESPGFGPSVPEEKVVDSIESKMKTDLANGDDDEKPSSMLTSEPKPEEPLVRDKPEEPRVTMADALETTTESAKTFLLHHKDDVHEPGNVGWAETKVADDEKTKEETDEVEKKKRKDEEKKPMDQIVKTLGEDNDDDDDGDDSDDDED